MSATTDLPPSPDRPWITRTLVGIIMATFFSDLSHEMCTAVLPLYLATVGLGPAALGIIEGVADFLVSLSKLAGGVVGHRVQRKQPVASAGYLVTTLATWGIGLVHGLAAVLTLRCVAWMARGFRSPLRDYLLADAVERKFYGRAFGLERAGDMLGAVAGPLTAAILIWAGFEFQTIILWTLVPGLMAAASMFFFTKEHEAVPVPVAAESSSDKGARAGFPRVFWLFLVGVFFFGLGDFSRTFLIWLAARAAGEEGGTPAGGLSLAVTLYMVHNLVSAVVAYPVGRLGDRRSKFPVLLLGFGLGVLTNILLAFLGGSLAWLIMVIVFSGVYIAIQETLQKAIAAELLPRERRSLGFGTLACANAVGDMVSSLYVGYLLQEGQLALAFGIAAAACAVGFFWITPLAARGER